MSHSPRNGARIMRISIRLKLWFSAAAVALVTGVASVLVLYAASLQEAAEHEALSTRISLQLLAELRAALDASAARTVAGLLSSGSALERQLAPQIAKAEQRAFALRAAIAGTGATPNAGSSPIERLARAYEEARDAARKLKSEGDVAAATDMVTAQVQPLLEGYQGALEQSAAPQYTHLEALDKTVAAARRISQLGLLGALALLLIVLAGSTFLLVRSICDPLQRLREMAQRIAVGDLTNRLEVDRNDEIGDLLTSLTAMQNALACLVGQVKATAGSIYIASDEVATGIQDLSQRTERTAARLQATASSMEHLGAVLGLSARSANEASRLSASAAEVAQKGSAAVTYVTEVMHNIDRSAQRIADILCVIEGIAIKTNLLALNAAVEAARAGEQGRGFAVVAEEVRSLARGSAEAARTIKTLIEESLGLVQSGASRVQDAHTTMGLILASSQKVTVAVSEIDTATTEQHRGIAQVQQSVVEIERNTLQNAALVEEGAAAAETMKNQASVLAEIVKRFNLPVGLEAA